MKHHTKTKGDIGLGYVISDLLSKEISVCLPISEHLPFDLIAVKNNGSLLKVSVKYRKVKKNVVTVQMRSTYSDSKRSYSKEIDKNLIDLIAIYCPDTNEVYYISPEEINKSLNLYVYIPKRKNKSIRLAQDYMEV